MTRENFHGNTLKSKLVSWSSIITSISRDHLTIARNVTVKITLPMVISGLHEDITEGKLRHWQNFA